MLICFLFFPRRQRQTRQAALLARRPIGETEEEIRETEELPELTEKEEQKAQKMTAFMQRYQQYKKEKGTVMSGTTGFIDYRRPFIINC